MSCILNGIMDSEQHRVRVSVLLAKPGVSFFTRRVLQRWERGEIDTDRLVELIQSDDAERIIAAWSDPVPK